ncbi:Cysteine desulfurase [Planctomycetes bacterium K23_9]|uniref:Cysteine desulfurase n=2 Tax=Stieleria marina TaxID=1930275 RepID=A0A517NS56_9BACT|nr:Cysteine desulfurase [Planctomycetes bacterium K23_9]
MQPYWSTHFMLPGQEHAHAQAIGEALDHAREGVAMLAGCDPFEVVFTSGGTESNNLAILGSLAQTASGHLLVSSMEHESVLAAVDSLADGPWEIETIPADSNGLVDPDQVASLLRPNTRLVAVQAANPVTGTIQSIREIADLVHNRGVHFHCDATQVFGKIPFDVSQMRADSMALSGHKFYGPKGSGALYVRRGLQVAPIAYGEPREMGLRPGAENVPGCIGIGAAARLASKCVVDAEANLRQLRDRFISGLRCVIDPEPVIVCEDVSALPNTVAVELPLEANLVQKSARELVFATALSSAPADEMTRSLQAIGKQPDQIRRTARFSFGWTTSRDQIDRSVDLIAEAWDASK